MSTTPIELPDLSDETMDRIEQAVFEQIAEERDGARTTTRRRSRRRGWLAAAGVAAAFVVGVLVTPSLLSVTGVGSSGSAVSSAPTGVSAPKSLAGTAKDSGSSSSSSSAVGSAPSASTAQRDIVRTGSATLQVKDVRAAADALGALAEKHGGYVESQQIGSSVPPIEGGVTPNGIVSPLPQTDGWVTMRIPAADLTTVMDALRTEGTVVSTSLSKDDVTGTTTDLRARVASLTTSVQRLTQLMAQASSVADLLAAETALTDRQSQLQGAEQQLKDLESQVAMSTLQVSLVREAPAAANPAGFGDGVAAGWHGLIVSLNALVIAVGFLLPWLAVALVIVLLVWGVVRLRRAGKARGAGGKAPAEE
ncbi:DUF4349 domain-containing protein [Microbacterium capsulatum]|uniref:DUF4349 domain-containing protein n=1 Tax=Microbacterium capsulatum TaxID=3041921 RepID=A0ABU0XBX0_9MICO|nr:DUF4349 domain-containing protein [Microbacterium sp. ASV81]MDQ4212606.1 DUF4349 domain-containing protein [Microbacterium sp. ASV81]